MSSKSERAETSQWEDEGGALKPQAVETDIDCKLAAHGIVSIPLTVYEWSGYRYTNARDAIAAAERKIR